MGQYDFIGDPGDSGVILGGFYDRGDGRQFLCMVDHAEKGIWLTDIDEDLPVATTKEEDERIGGNWYGTRAEFDAAGWNLVGVDWNSRGSCPVDPACGKV